MTLTAAATPDADSGEAATDSDSGEANTDSDSGVPQSRRSRLVAAVRPYVPDGMIHLVFLLLAVWLTHGLWPDPASRALALNPQDQTLFEWFLANDARMALGDFGLLTERLNAPDGVNVMANTSVLTLGLLFAPVTLVFGAPTTFAVLAAGNLAATAIAWYLLYVRGLRARRLAAALGAGFCGFGPGMISQTNAHLHMTAQWLVPVTVWLIVRMLRAADPTANNPDPAAAGRSRTDGAGTDWRRIVTSAVGLAVVVVAQVFAAEEVVFLTALTLAVLTVVYAFVRPSLARRVLPGFAAGLLIAAGLGVIALAHPLWFQFAGPQSVSGGLFSPDYFSADLASWAAISPLSVAGMAGSARLTTGPAEYNTFLGWPLLLVAVACAGWLRRHPLVIAGTVTGLVMAALSMGPTVIIDGERTTISGPYTMFLGLPVVDSALPMRFALPLIPIIATVLVLAVDRALRGDQPARWLVPTAVVGALLPIFPMPLPTTGRPPVPEFVSAGHWRDCVEPGGVLVPVPLPTPRDPWSMRWPTAVDVEFGVPEGIFNGPYAGDGKASVGTYKQPTSALLAKVAETGTVPPVGEPERQRARQDIGFWRASCVVLADDAPNLDSLRITLEALFGPSTRVADAWTWRVRG